MHPTPFRLTPFAARRSIAKIHSNPSVIRTEEGLPGCTSRPSSQSCWLRHLCLRDAAQPAGQAQTAGSIVGRATDESGGVLPGVTVTATSPALQLPQVVDVTDAQGDYRLTPLPIGTYEVAYTLTGFQTVRRDTLRLTAGFVARVDVALKVGALEESITVSATPTIDVQSTGAVTVLTRETLEVVPSSRAGIITLMNQSPSVRSQLDVGGSQSNQLPAMRVYGIATQATSWLVLDGVVTTDAGQTGGGGSYFDYASFEEARMQTIANDVETPNRGINLNLIVKSGGNQSTATRPGSRRAASSRPRTSTTICERRTSPRPTTSAAGFTAALTSAAALF